MQTFLPYRSMFLSAITLDTKRHGNQRNEATTILKALHQGPKILYDKQNKKYMWFKPLTMRDGERYIIKKTPWYYHVATQMWKGYEEALELYRNTIIKTWILLGHANNVMLSAIDESSIKLPPWLGDERLHSSHRAALLFKKPLHYLQFEWLEKQEQNYYWPKNDQTEINQP
ncbi:MAG: pyrimidine dimer DNA glycosylase/endonuclease V [Desulfobacteraceae bacterium]|jgi:hypothetical protein